jgi:hypothetical protein
MGAEFDVFSVVARPALTTLLVPEQPAWTRLLPISMTGDPKPGLDAAVHDPLWLLARQWQFGEFMGDDAGSPISVEAVVVGKRVSAWRAGSASGAGQDCTAPETELESLIECEPAGASAPAIYLRLEAGAVLVDMLADAGHDVRDALMQACRLSDGLDARPELAALAGLMPDAQRAAEQLGGAPPWMAGALPAAVAAAADWLVWWSLASAGSGAPPQSGAWDMERLEYSFSLKVAEGDDAETFVAPAHHGAAVDWYAFDRVGRDHLADPIEAERPPGAASVLLRRVEALPTPLRYPGMPSDRLWAFEDSAVHFGGLDVQAHDLARLCLIEFATIYGSDWFVLPIDIPAGSLARISEFSVTDTFGITTRIGAVSDETGGRRFEMFQIADAGARGAQSGLFVPANAATPLEGEALEEIRLMRDEQANLVWAIEARIEGDDGDSVALRGMPETSPVAGTVASAEPYSYVFGTDVPSNWIPFVPMVSEDGRLRLRKGTMTETDMAQGRMLAGKPLDLLDCEVPRDGVIVRRIPMLGRTPDGRFNRWVARRVSTGRGVGESRLAYDNLIASP